VLLCFICILGFVLGDEAVLNARFLTPIMALVAIVVGDGNGDGAVAVWWC
jgi:hypothetical protein